MTSLAADAGSLAAPLLQAGGGFAASPEGRQVVASGALDWILLGLAVVTVAAVTVLCVKYFLRPGEETSDHIKRRVLEDEVGSG